MSAANQNHSLKSLETRFRKNQVIFREGELTRDLYILLSGEVEIQKNRQKIGVVRTPDTYLGEMSTLLGSPRTATLIATTDCLMICIPKNKVLDFLKHSPELGLKLARILALRLRQMNGKYERLLKKMAADIDEEDTQHG